MEDSGTTTNDGSKSERLKELIENAKKHCVLYEQYYAYEDLIKIYESIKDLEDLYEEYFHEPN